MGKENKEGIIQIIVNMLEKKPVLFVYLYGSFLERDDFHDVDIGTYFEERKFQDKDEIFSYALNLSARLTIETGIDIDLHPLNLTPIPFSYQVIKNGKIIFERDDEERIKFETRTIDMYLDFKPKRGYYYRRVILGENNG